MSSSYASLSLIVNEMVNGSCAHQCCVSGEGKLLQHCMQYIVMSCWMRAKDERRFFVLLRLIEKWLKSEYW
jgi:hypothetical protein